MAAVTSAVIFELRKIKSVTVYTFSPSICHEVMGLDAAILVFWRLSFKPAFSLSSFIYVFICLQVFQNLPVNAGDMDLITGSGRSSGRGIATLFSILAWKVPWMRLVGCSPWGGRVGHDLMSEHTHTRVRTHTYKFIFLKIRWRNCDLGLLMSCLKPNKLLSQKHFQLFSFFFDDYLSSHGRRE